MNQINVLGIDLNNFSLKEALVLTETYLQEGPLKTILYVDANMLMLAGSNEEYKECLQKCDLTIIDDEGILEVLPKVNAVKIEDIKEEKYTRILLKKLVYGHKKIALLADTTDNLESLNSNLLNYRNDLEIISRVSMDALENSTESMINVINDVVPDVVISKMEMEKQAALMEEARNMMNCKLWIGLPERPILLRDGESIFKKIWHKISRRTFKQEVNRYNTRESEENDIGQIRLKYLKKIVHCTIFFYVHK